MHEGGKINDFASAADSARHGSHLSNKPKRPRFSGSGRGIQAGVIIAFVVLMGVFLVTVGRLVRDIAHSATLDGSPYSRRAEGVPPVWYEAVRPPETRAESPSLAPLMASRPRALESPAHWVTPDDYPDEALRAEEEGTVGFRLALDTRGRPSSCVITRSSGVPALDRTTCDLMMQRARYSPARDAGGVPVKSAISMRFRWQLTE